MALFHAALLTTFFGAFCPSETLASSKKDTSGRSLHMSNLVWIESSMVLTLRCSKTNQKGIDQTVMLREALGLPLSGRNPAGILGPYPRHTHGDIVPAC